MPRLSLRKQVLKELETIINKRKSASLLQTAMVDDSDSDMEDLNVLDDTITGLLEEAHKSVSSKRYLLNRGRYRKGFSATTFERDLAEDDNDDGTPPWLSDDEFLQKYRMHRDSFKAILSLIKDNPAFHLKWKKKQAPVEYQLLVFLFYIGTSGSGASFPRCRQMFGIGRGTCKYFIERVSKAIRSLRNQVITWPNRQERVQIARRFRNKYDFINLIAIADGTLFPLTYQPESDDAPDYHGRKFAYSMTCMIVNDDNKKIRFYLSGFPGCVHDNRVYSHTPLFQNPNDYFGNNFYLLSDSAISNSSSVVASFVCPKGHKLPERQEQFNTLLGRARVLSEHTIGMLKGRFQILKSMPMVINNSKKSVKRILRIIDCCVILHNLLIDTGDIIPPDWIEKEQDDSDEEDDDCSDVGTEIGEYNMINQVQNGNDDRRQRCMDYFTDMGLLSNE
jgi:hypothetical protein